MRPSLVNIRSSWMFIRHESYVCRASQPRSPAHDKSGVTRAPIRGRQHNFLLTAQEHRCDSCPQLCCPAGAEAARIC